MPFSSLTHWLPKSIRESDGATPTKPSLRLESLESREVLNAYTWIGGGLTDTWSNNANWQNGQRPSDNETGVQVTFNGNTSSTMDLQNVTFTHLTFNNGGTSLGLDNPITLDGSTGVQLLSAAGANSIGGAAIILGGSANSWMEVDSGSTLQVNSTLTGTRGLRMVNGSGVLELTKDNDYQGDTYVDIGFLRLNTPIGGGSAIKAGTQLTVGDGNGTSDAYVQLASAAQLASTTPIIVKADAVFTQINGANNVIGDLDLQGGQVSAGTGNLAIKDVHAGADGLITGGAGGKITLLNGQHTIKVEGGKKLTIDIPIINAGGGTVGGITKTGGGELYLHNMTATPNSYTGLTQVDDGTLSLWNQAQNSAFLGNLSIGDGQGATAMVRLEASHEIPNGADVTLARDGYIDLNGFNETVGPLTITPEGGIIGHGGTLTLNGNVTVPQGNFFANIEADVNLGGATRTFTVQSAANSLVINGKITGTGGLTKDGLGVLDMEGTATNDYTGVTTVTGGTLELSHTPGFDAIPHNLIIGSASGVPGSAIVRSTANAQIADTADVLVAGGGRLDIAAGSEFIHGLLLGNANGGGEVITHTGTLTLGSDVSVLAAPTTSTISGNLSLGNAARTFSVQDGAAATDLQVDAVVSAGGVVKTGAGKMVLSGNNTYTGDTILQAGMLVVNGTQLGSDVTTTAGTVAGNGAVGKVSGPATVAPGTSIGTLNTQDLTLTGVLSAEVSKAASDRINVTGSVNLTGATLNLNVLSPTSIGQVITLIDNDGVDPVVGTFNGLSDGATFTADGRTYRINYNVGAGNNDVTLTDVTVNTPPILSDVADQTNPSGAIPFTVGDTQTPAGMLQVSFGSSNTTLFPSGSIMLGGSGSNRTITLTPAAGQSGTATITLTVTDSDGATTTDTFLVTVTAPIVPPGSPSHVDLYAVGADAGGGPHVRVFNADGSERFSFYAYDANFHGGVSVASADVTGDGIDDIITAARAGGGPHVKVFDGATGQEIRSFYAYDAAFSGGVSVAAGDVNGDGLADIITGAGPGGGPHVKVFDGATNAEIRSFYAYHSGYSGGVSVAAGDVNGDGHADIIVGPGADSDPHVKAFDGVTGAVVRDFFAYTGFTGGVNVAAGDLDGDGKAEIITGAGPGGGPHVKVWSGTGPADTASFYAFDAAFSGGVRVAVVDTDGDGKMEVLASSGAGMAGTAKRFDPFGNEMATIGAFPGFNGGVFVG